MKSYLFIESRSAFEATGAVCFFALACDLRKAGHKVEVMLVQNGVAAARAGAASEGLDAVLRAGISVMADDFSLRERALPPERLMRGVKPGAIGTVVDRMADGWHVMWH